MRRLLFLPSADRDLVNILDYITEQAGNADIGLRFTESLRAQCQKLASLPGTLGVARPDLRPDLRSFPFRGYIIFFRYLDDVFEVVSILERHRDVIAYFASGDRSPEA